jgi:uncharacterized protein YbjT (DUF2867 family)
MKVFVTGAAGFIGAATTKELLANGHEVLGLARSDANAAALERLGAKVHRGSLEDLDSLRTGAQETDGTIHLAFIHDFSKFVENGQIDKRAIEAMGDVRRERPLSRQAPWSPKICGATPGRMFRACPRRRV